MKSLLSGPKFNRRHQTYIPGSEEILRELKSLGSVKKIFLGKISPSGSGSAHTKIRSVQGHLIEIVYRGQLAIQIFRVVSSDLSAVHLVINKYSRKSKQPKKKKEPKGSAPKKKGSTPKKKEHFLRQAQSGKPAQLGDLFPEIELLKNNPGKPRERPVASTGNETILTEGKAAQTKRARP